MYYYKVYELNLQWGIIEDLIKSKKPIHNPKDYSPSCDIIQRITIFTYYRIKLFYCIEKYVEKCIIIIRKKRR